MKKIFEVMFAAIISGVTCIISLTVFAFCVYCCNLYYDDIRQYVFGIVILAEIPGFLYVIKRKNQSKIAKIIMIFLQVIAYCAIITFFSTRYK